jgi:hypothetical protein
MDYKNIIDQQNKKLNKQTEILKEALKYTHLINNKAADISNELNKQKDVENKIINISDDVNYEMGINNKKIKEIKNENTKNNIIQTAGVSVFSGIIIFFGLSKFLHLCTF